MKPLMKAIDVMILLAAVGLIFAGHRAEGGGMALGWLFATISHYE
jgi:multisubunit Na+/H+ antiporter MnhB subunit